MTEDVTQAVDVDAPRERVWQLLTNPAELPRWWPDAAELQPGVGGRIVLRFGPGDVSGEITEWEPPAALAFTWQASNMPGVELHVAFKVRRRACPLVPVERRVRRTDGRRLRPAVRVRR